MCWEPVGGSFYGGPHTHRQGVLVTSTPTPAPSAAPSPTGRAAAAVGLTKVYGHGDTRVVALDEISCEFTRGQFTAIMGPSGSGKSTLMHCLAGLDDATSGAVFVGDTDITTLDDKRLTRLRRDAVGFVFQAFNLLPTLTAIENITLPMSLAGRKPDKEWLDTVGETVRLLHRLHPPPAGPPVRRSSPAVNSSGSRPRGRSPASRTSSSPTNRPETSTPRPAPRSSPSCVRPCASSVRRS